MRLRVERDPAVDEHGAVRALRRGDLREQRERGPRRGREARVAPFPGGEEREPPRRAREQVQHASRVPVGADLLAGGKRRRGQLRDRLPDSGAGEEAGNRVGRSRRVLDVDRPGQNGGRGRRQRECGSG